MISSDIISGDDKEAYIYAYTIMLEKVLTLITIGIIGIVLHRLVYIIIFLCIFMLLRRRTGGFHLETFGQCFIGTNIICIIIEACDFIWLLDNSELRESKKRARIVAALEVLLITVLCIAGIDRIIIVYMAMGINICALLLFMSKVQSRIKGEAE